MSVVASLADKTKTKHTVSFSHLQTKNMITSLLQCYMLIEELIYFPLMEQIHIQGTAELKVTGAGCKKGNYSGSIIEQALISWHPFVFPSSTP